MRGRCDPRVSKPRMTTSAIRFFSLFDSIHFGACARGYWHRISYDAPFVSFPLLLKYRTHLVLWYPLFSHTLRNRTRSPDAVNMGTEKSSEIGGLLHAFLSFSVG